VDSRDEPQDDFCRSHMPASLSFAHGLIRARTMSADTARRTIADLERLHWQPAKVALKHDVYRVRELVDSSQRDALSIGSDGASDVLRTLVGAVREHVLSTIEMCWSLKLRDLSSPQLTQYRKGHFIRAHRDTGDAYPDRIFSAVTYLSDDYEGGEICFPTIRETFHPSAGETLVFPADFVHEVRPVTAGRKFVFLFFVDRPPRRAFSC
jgi:predicted 2-oxoglutarate/Fe(II)-dependent dioxygenase YbiX